SLVIFATLILPHLTDTLKMLAMYIASIAVLSAGLLLHKKNKNNLFYIAIIGCGAGSLYLSLLLSNIYFEVIGDLALYGLILLWAVFVKYLTKIKHYVFTIIGQAGIFIASVLGTMMCVFESDPQKYFVLSIFYFISAFVFSNVSTTYLMPLLRSRENDEQPALSLSSYESNLCTHICKTLNVGVFASGFLSLEHAIHRHSASSGPSALIIFNVVLFIIYLLAEYFFSYKEKCKDGLAFQILTMANTILAIVLINDLDLFTINQVCVFIYLAGIATLLYVEKKDAGYTIFSQICCPFLILFGCVLNPWMREHLYIYLTAVPFMLYGQWKKKGFYLGVGIAYWVLLPLAIWAEHYNCIEYLIVMAVVYGVFLYTCRKTEQTWYKITGYLVLCYTTLTLVYDISYTFMGSRSTPTNARLLTFLLLAVIHLVLNKLKYFGREQAVEVMMIAINAFLMVGGCLGMYDTDAIFLKLPVILVTILLFMINSKELLSKHKYAGYYVALKYTALMLCIINSYDAVDYVTSICLLVFAVISIVTGFYKDMIAFRLYGLILSMLSVVKLIMFDIKYDSTIESAVSFFISGVLCFVISFIYNRIDGKLRGK
ncbi:MAG: DUF2339 domain-containing protein, partial [Lachnospiraceae bacterium]|nr:DUF2339 domain-containing protein [Lachnospiraceae bacterium]